MAIFPTDLGPELGPFGGRNAFGGDGEPSSSLRHLGLRVGEEVEPPLRLPIDAARRSSAVA